MENGKITITGAAGLVGQNLLIRLKARGHTNIVAIDKSAANCATLRRLHPDIVVIETDLYKDDGWQQAFEDCQALVVGHAQIGGLFESEYLHNNVQASERVVQAAVRYSVPYLVNISSSVVNSAAVDYYTETKKKQEAIVAASGIQQVILRPTLMFGWFDRKHVGWLARFMQKTPVFPIPGDGKFLRQPLFEGDFCDVIIAAIDKQITGAFNISGQQRVDYIDLIRMVKDATGAKARIQTIPYQLFWALLKINSFFDRNPPFTTNQLAALVTPDVFEVIDWPGIFGVRSTPLQEALEITFRDPVYSKIALEF